MLDGVKEALKFSDSDNIVADELITALEDRDKKIRRRAIKWLRDVSFNLKPKASEVLPHPNHRRG